MTDERKLRQYISPAVKGPNIEDLIYVLSKQFDNLDQLAQSVNNQLTITTASEAYLDKRISEIGLVRPGDVGISDFATKQIAQAITAKKQVREVVDELLKIFYGTEAVKANTKSTTIEPYSLEVDDDLAFEVDGTPHVYTVQAGTFDNLSAVSARELAAAISRYLLQIGSLGLAAADQFEGKLILFGGANGTTSRVKVTGGRIQNKLLFPEVKDTQADLTDTQWQVTRTEGATLRFRWVNGSKPLLNEVLPGDRVMIYGPDFVQNGIEGTFTVMASVPAGSSPTLDSGWFEIEDEAVQGLQQTVANQAPISSSLPYAITVTEQKLRDLTFFTANEAKPFLQQRFALTFEPGKNRLKVYLPAVTKVVYRDLIGGMHLNIGLESKTVDGIKQNINKINDLCLYVTDDRPDTYSTGGTFSWDQWSPLTSYSAGDLVTYTVSGVTNNYLAVASSTNQAPQLTSTVYWQVVGRNLDYCSREEGKLKFVFTEPHGVTTTNQQAFVADTQEDYDQTPILGPYSFDPEASYQLRKEGGTLRQSLDQNSLPSTILVNGEIPDEPGILILGLNSSREEEPVRFVSAKKVPGPAAVNIVEATQNGTVLTVQTDQPHNVVPGEKTTIAGTGIFDGTFTVTNHVSNTVYQVTRPSFVGIATTGTSTPVFSGPVTNIILSNTYELKFTHGVGERADLLSSDTAVEPEDDGSDYQAYVTGIAEAREFAKSLIEKVVAAGVYVEFVIVYPSSIGLGGGDRPVDGNLVNDVVYVYGV